MDFHFLVPVAMATIQLFSLSLSLSIIRPLGRPVYNPESVYDV